MNAPAAAQHQVHYDMPRPTHQPISDPDIDAFVCRIEEEIVALRESATSMNDKYAHSGLTDPRADRLIVRADGMEYVLSTFLDVAVKG